MRKIQVYTCKEDDGLEITTMYLSGPTMTMIDDMSRMELLKEISFYKEKYLPRLFNEYLTTRNDLSKEKISHKLLQSRSKVLTLAKNLENYMYAKSQLEEHNKRYTYMRYKLENPDIKTYKDIPKATK
jgi:hypothetical protein